MPFEWSVTIVLLLCVSIYVTDYFLVRNRKTVILKTRWLAVYFERWKYLDSFLVFLVAFVTIFIVYNHAPTQYNNYSYFARALLGGRIDVPDMPSWLERVVYNGKTYLHLAPGPAIVLLPFIAIWGIDFNTNLICILFGALSIAVFYNILKRFAFDDPRSRVWLTALFGFGTVHFWLSAIGDSWFFGQVMTTFFLLLAMYFIFRKKDSESPAMCFLSGFFFACSVTCRITIVLSGVFFVVFILKYYDRKIQSLGFFVLGALIPGSLYMAYNYLRFDNILDLGYVIKHYAERTDNTVGALDARFIPFNLFSLFIMGPDFIDKFPFIAPNFMGLSLTFSCPALYYAIKAKGEPFFVRLLWIAVAIGSVPFLLSPGNGFAQFGMRYAMDFIPFLILLAASGLKDLTNINRIVILACIWINFWGVLHWNMPK